MTLWKSEKKADGKELVSQIKCFDFIDRTNESQG